eukprot:scaffold4820_cov67-Phaeocystis_antarctica.AAC.1
MQGDAGRCREMQGDAGRCREMQGDEGCCREMQGDAGRCCSCRKDGVLTAFDSEPWAAVSEPCKALLRSILHVKPGERATPAQATLTTQPPPSPSP